MKRKIDSILRDFGMANLMAEISLDQIEKRFSIDLGRLHGESEFEDTTYYPQFPERIRINAKKMAMHYELFFCLEQFLRATISERLKTEHGENWWTTHVPEVVRKNVEYSQKREEDEGVTVRSTAPIDYTTFGELGEIVKANWDVFQDTFNSLKALERILGRLNTVRGPIAHCSVLADDEVDRLKLSLKDLFRQME